MPVAVDLLFVVGHGDRDPGLSQDLGVGQALVEQWVVAGHDYVGRRQPGMVGGPDRGGVRLGD